MIEQEHHCKCPWCETRGCVPVESKCLLHGKELTCVRGPGVSRFVEWKKQDDSYRIEQLADYEFALVLNTQASSEHWHPKYKECVGISKAVLALSDTLEEAHTRLHFWRVS